MPHWYFLSDLHLGLEGREAERAKVRRILSVLDDVIRDGSGLYLVGDVFDLWFEYRHVVPKGHERFLAKLADVAEAGVPITYLSGNHDFWLGRYFADEFGCTLSDDPIDVTLNGVRFHLAHGDGLAGRDLGYKILKRILRARANRWLYLKLHPNWGIGLASWASRTSRVHTGGKDYGPNDGLRLHAQSLISTGVDVVVMGHRHAPTLTEYSGLNGHVGAYLNTGDWLEHHTYATFDGATVALWTRPDPLAPPEQLATFTPRIAARPTVPAQP